MSSQPKTPYDAELESVPTNPLERLRRQTIQSQRKGYLQALRDQAPALELLRDYMRHFDDESLTDKQCKAWLDSIWLPQARAAIEAAGGAA